MEYKKFKKAALQVALKAGYIYDEDEKTGDVVIHGTGETWVAVRSMDRSKIDRILADEGEDYDNPAIWLADQEKALESSED